MSDKTEDELWDEVRSLARQQGKTMKVSFCVMTFNEFDPTRAKGERFFRSFSAAYDHPGIDEIVVVDDGSDDWEWLQERMKEYPKVKLYHNEQNLGVFLNKIEIVAQATSDWVITCDSDNYKDKAHINKVLELLPDTEPDVWLCESRALPHLDYREFCGEYNLNTISRFDEGGYVKRNLGRCCLNTGNQTVHRQRFMEVFSRYRGTRYWLDLWEQWKDWCGFSGVNVHEREKRYWRQIWDANDSMLFVMFWLFAGNRIRVTPGLEHDHYVGHENASNYDKSGSEKGPLGDALLKYFFERAEEDPWVIHA